MYTAAVRKQIDGTLQQVPVSEIIVAELRLDADSNQIHGNYATLYLNEIPLRASPSSSSLVVDHGGTPLTYRNFPLTTALGALEYTVDFSTGIVFLDPGLDGESLTVTYEGTGGVINWEKLQSASADFDGGNASG